ncbi:MAG: hypothetical protein RIF32_03780 [Leptospirales bacterium]
MDPAWHDPYDGLFGQNEPRFTLLERRYLLLTWFAGELGDGELVQAIEAVGEDIDADTDGALDRLDQLEERMLALLESRLDLPDLGEFPADAPALREIRNRLRALLCVAFFQEDPEGGRQTLALARQIVDGLPHSYEKTLEVADADLSIREELLLEVVAGDAEP